MIMKMMLAAGDPPTCSHRVANYARNGSSCNKKGEGTDLPLPRTKTPRIHVRLRLR